MGQNRYEKSVELPASVEEAFAWHEREGAFERLTPPWVRARVVDRYGGIQDGGEVTIELRKGPCKWRWVAMHQNYTQDVRFQDIQVTGPFAAWCHTHRFESLGDSQSRITDTISYRLPLGFLGEFFAGKLIRHDLERMFAWRHGVTASDLAAHQRYATAPRRKILISGASGLVGRNLSAFLSTGGHDVWHLTRQLRGESKRQIVWDTEQIAPETLEPFDTVIHLAGENIFGLWTAGKFRRIRDSRVNSTRALAQALARFPQGTKNFICASAIGFYGSRWDECLDESSSPGGNLLAQIAREWEAATQPAIDAGVRVALMRLGVVLTPQGGALGKMLPPFQMGLGGRIGSGRQWMGWVSIEDVIGAFHHAVMNPDFSGAANVVSPEPVTNAQFAQELARCLHRPAILPVPALAGKALAGRMFDELLLSSARVVPRKLQGAGYEFRHARLGPALNCLLGREPAQD